jgi:putative transport protein
LRLIFVAIAVVIIALFATLMAGHFLFHLHPGILLGACSGACTATPALAAVQEAAKSSVPTLGYGVSYAVGNVLLALGGKVIVLLLV